MSNKISVGQGESGFLIVGLGEVLWDCFPTGDLLGGAPLNFAAHAQQLGEQHGIRAAMVSRIGQDELGTRALEQIGKMGLDASAIQRDEKRGTGRVNVTLDNGQPTYEILRDVAWDYLQWDEALESIQQKADVICFGTLGQRSEQSRNVIQRFVRDSRAKIRLLDVNLRAPFIDSKVTLESLRLVNCLKLNEEELFWLASLLGVAVRESAEELAQALRFELTLDYLLLTRGERGCVLITAEDVIEAAVPRYAMAPNADAVGAGDAAAAAFAVGLLRGLDSKSLVALANRAGSFVASRSGAVPCMPHELTQ
jgi:fructokinase